ncbi:cell division protein FtsQ [Streptomyces sannanensis]|uniref:Cell division protein FtsQ n=1 Tax=Streptomyces sannanensis TaxID=285536 RepID=A0ABP6S8L1_9ACTN
MAGSTTAQRGTRKAAESGRSRSSRGGTSGGRFRIPLRRGPLLLLVTAVLLAGGAVWVLYGSSWLRVEGVSTTGTEALTPAEVEAVAAVPVGAPLVSVDTDAMETRLLRELPRIDSVEVFRSWPDGVGLKVTERQPALIIQKGTDFVEVDAKGTRFATVRQRPEGVPLLELTPERSPSLRRFGTGRLLREAVRVTEELPAAVARDIKVVRVRSYDAISVELRGGRTVIWGSGEQGAAKARALTALMKAAPKARHFDVSAPSAPAAASS